VFRFTLSGLLFQINLKHLLSISFLYFFGLIVPIFTYVASACVVPKKYRKEIDSKCFKFIWNNKPDKVKRNTVVGKLGNGGLRMIDIQSYFFIRFIIPNKFEAFAIYFFPIFFWNNTGTSQICKYWNN
jgi:hypothetical protein